MPSKEQNEDPAQGPNAIVPLWKPLGRTPLEAIRRFVGTHPSYKDVPAAYAGRLDPMAEGIVLALFGEATKRMDEHLLFDKTYVATFLLGFSTDTYDVLGVIHELSRQLPPPEDAARELSSFKGEFTFPLPPYSSYRVNGKPLFHWARRAMLPELPIRTVRISGVAIEKAGLLPVSDIRARIHSTVPHISGDFRQDEIVAAWDEALASSGLNEVPFVRAKISCESGTYIRAIAHELGQRLSVPVLLYSLVRTRIGSYTAADAVILD